MSNVIQRSVSREKVIKKHSYFRINICIILEWIEISKTVEQFYLFTTEYLGIWVYTNTAASVVGKGIYLPNYASRSADLGLPAISFHH